MNYTTLLEKLGISQSFTMELHMNREDFVRQLKYKVDEKEVSSFFDVPIAFFSTGSNDFKGQVSMSEFRLKPKRHFFSRNNTPILATGRIEERQEKTVLTVRITALETTEDVALFLAFFALYAMFATAILANSSLLVLLLVLLLLLIALILVMQFEVRKMRNSLTVLLKALVGDL